MDARLARLADGYRTARPPGSTIADALHALYERHIRQREQSLLEAASASVAVGALSLADGLDYSRITPQMEEAFRLAFPNVELNSLVSRAAQDVEGFLSPWKGKYFEVLVRDKLNSGEWVGDIHLAPGQVARLAESATQARWDLQILDPDGSIATELQAKATDSLGYVSDALERYPDIDFVVTDEVSDTAAALSDRIVASGVSDEALEKMIQEPTASLLDSPLEELAEDVLPFLPFVLIAVGEGRKVMVGRKSLQIALADALERSAKSGAAIGVGALVALLDGGLLSIPASFLTRIGFDRWKVLGAVAKQLDARIDATRELADVYHPAVLARHLPSVCCP